jgi:hypothetical protein
MRKALIIACTSVFFVPRSSTAHIKWFCTYDTAVPPLDIGNVITPVFVFTASFFGILMFISYVIDRTAARNGWFHRIERAFGYWQPSIAALIRLSVGGFFLTLWVVGGLILTPELKTTCQFTPWLQLMIAIAVLFRRTLPIAAVGIVALYVHGIVEYGAFHMMDYPIFLGLAVYLGLSASDHPYLLNLRLPALYFNLALTMMWGAIEKFGYPYWTLPLLASHKALTFGMPFDLFMIVAGFVEVSLAFFMLTGTALLRLSCLALLTLLVLAIPAFGTTDAIGHALIVAGLAAMTIAGQSGIQLPAILRREGVIADATLMTVAYGATIVVLFGAYYSAQYLAGG